MNRKVLLYVAPPVLGGLLLVSLFAYHNNKVAAIQEAAQQKAARQVEIPAGTRLRVRLDQALGTTRNRRGDRFSAMLDAPVTENGIVLVPKGTPFRGHITAAKPSGWLKGRGYMTIALDSFDLNGQTYRLTTNHQSRVTGSHKKRNWELIGGGSGFGALVGGLAGAGKGLLIGSGAGAAAGVAGAAFTGKKNVYLPAETALTFHLTEPVLIESYDAGVS
jgi:hypothetical protein